jgi:hypothetical protein
MYILEPNPITNVYSSNLSLSNDQTTQVTNTADIAQQVFVFFFTRYI